jgi:hypothetical protein
MIDTHPALGRHDIPDFGRLIAFAFLRSDLGVDLSHMVFRSARSLASTLCRSLLFFSRRSFAFTTGSVGGVVGTGISSTPISVIGFVCASLMPWVFELVFFRLA